MRNSRRIIAMVGIAFVIAIGAMAGTAANAAIVPTAAPIAAVPTSAPAVVAGEQGQPSTGTGDPSGSLTILGVALTGIGVVMLRGRSVRHL